MTETKILKRKLLEVVETETALCELDESERKRHKDKLLCALDSISSEVAAINDAVKRRKAEKAEDDHKKTFAKVLQMTQSLFPEMLKKVENLRVDYDPRGVLWTRGHVEYCYSIDRYGDCDVDAHNCNYYEDMKISAKRADDDEYEYIFHLQIDCRADEIEHSDEKAYVSVDLKKTMDFTMDYDKSLFDVEEPTFMRWAAKVHRIYYNDYAELSDQEPHKYTKELECILFGYLAEETKQESAEDE